MTFKERRRAKRVKADLALTITGERGEANGKTLNISTNGVLIQSPRFIEPLTKVSFELLLPKGAGAERKLKSISIEGVVVRVEPEKEEPSQRNYNVAVFFTMISDTAQRALAKFIESRLPA